MFQQTLFSLTSVFLASLVACAGDDPAILHKGFIYEKASYPECHASKIEETPAGLVAAWFGGTGEKYPDVGIWVSRHIDGN